MRSKKPIENLKIAIPKNYYYDHVTTEVRELLDASLKIYEELGAHIVEVSVPDHDKISDLASVVMGSEAATLHGDWIRERPGDYSDQVLARIQPGLAYPSTHYLRALQIRPEITNRFVEDILGECDVFHAPVLSFPTPTIAESDLRASPGFADFLSRMSYCTRPINYLGLPSIAVPAGFTSNGLPTSFQLVGRPFSEGLLFQFAAAYQKATDWHRQSPRFN